MHREDCHNLNLLRRVGWLRDSSECVDGAIHHLVLHVDHPDVALGGSGRGLDFHDCVDFVDAGGFDGALLEGASAVLDGEGGVVVGDEEAFAVLFEDGAVGDIGEGELSDDLVLLGDESVAVDDDFALLGVDLDRGV